MTGSRVGRIAGAVLSAAALVALAGCSSSAGSCVAPALSVSPTTVHAGDALAITVANAFGECSDTGPYARRPVAEQVEIVLSASDGTETVLVQDRPDDDAALSAEVVVPAGTSTGAATVTMTAPEGAQPVTLTVLSN
ncbi:hypothetical protein [Microbacterium rhizophilus]|uniref:hypothetical protein n=1 Tax=Microbacterium rhizophilus TaxID=3138934 RepID=UPI0031E627FB